MALLVERIPTLRDNYTYMLVCQQTGEAAVVDAPEAEPVQRRAEKLGARVTKILSTHHHPDHSQANPELAKRYDAPVYGHGPSLEDFSRETPLTVGSPQQVIDRTLGFREYVGDYQRQLFLIDHAGLPLKTVLEQLDLLGEEVVPVLRKEFAALKPAHVPDAPTHASMLAARSREQVPA